MGVSPGKGADETSTPRRWIQITEAALFSSTPPLSATTNSPSQSVLNMICLLAGARSTAQQANGARAADPRRIPVLGPASPAWAWEDQGHAAAPPGMVPVPAGQLNDLVRDPSFPDPVTGLIGPGQMLRHGLALSHRQSQSPGVAPGTNRHPAVGLLMRQRGALLPHCNTSGKGDSLPHGPVDGFDRARLFGSGQCFELRCECQDLA
ncbi:hypothetical protein QFZ79_001063 [Arthrobacter sp. V4I6]|nr:hypothetical protein [Arthrobacter sp. V1I7]MDQ0852952.1 hypothetical protein [Arthrobacter sp. V4I6]